MSPEEWASLFDHGPLGTYGQAAPKAPRFSTEQDAAFLSALGIEPAVIHSVPKDPLKYYGYGMKGTGEFK